ncbi:MAG TPA: GNAT family N-acetyltransferase [Pyrinomonadaceae bacterium]|nr:GNAT family N-acetyltransferase [Pyrinomonadaceae bacterium]
MEIQREEHGRKGAFFIEENGEWLAELSYIRNGPNTMVIDHTEVVEDLAGQDVGRKLVDAAVAFARENGLKIRPLCPFVKKVIDSDTALQDVLA